MIFDDQPGYPMAVNMEWAFRGKIHRETLIEAFNRTVEHEPLFRATAVKNRGKFVWNVSEEATAKLDFALSSESIEAESGQLNVAPIDLARETAKILVVEHPDGVSFQVLSHHAIGDGIGVNDFFCSWMKEYELLLNSVPSNPVTVPWLPDESLFPHREELHFTAPEKVSSWVIMRELYKGILQWFWRRPFPLIESKPKPEYQRCTDFPMYWRKLPADFIQPYRQKAKSLSVSLNTMMMRDMYIVLKDWLSERYPTNKNIIDDSRWIRMLVPMNLRTDFHKNMPCTNILGYIFMDKKIQDCNRSDASLQEIQNLMSQAKKWNMGSRFIDGIKVVEKIPGLLKRITSNRYCHSTIVLSSVGNLCKCAHQDDYRTNDDISIQGDYPLQLIRILGAPPTRPNTPLSFGVVQHKKEMFLSCRYDINVIDKVTMLNIFDRFISEMSKAIE